MEPMVNIALQAARSAGNLIVKAASKLDRIQVDEKRKARMTLLPKSIALPKMRLFII
jgi:fructose-1,6-bisphosphatase/inositol monophosphatase family enzyme